MSGHGTPIPMTSRPCGPLKGEAHVPGDKSISHRSLILGAMAVGETRNALAICSASSPRTVCSMSGVRMPSSMAG